MKPWHRPLLACGVIAGFLGASDGIASPPIEFFGGGASTNALSTRSLGVGAGVSYFHPALLTQTNPGFTVAAFMVGESSQIRLLERPVGSDLSPAIYQATVDGLTPRHRPLPTGQLATRNTTSRTETLEPLMDIGLVAPLVGRKLVFGFFARLPVAQFQSMESFFPDEREQYFSNNLHPALRGDRLRLGSFALAFGSQIVPWLAIGAGLTLSLDTQASTQVFLPDSLDQERILVNSKLKVQARVAPHGSLRLQVAESAAISFGFKAAAGQDISNTNEVLFWSQVPSADQSFNLTTGFQPMSLFITGDWTLTDDASDDRVVLGAELLWENWSAYTNRHGESPLLAWDDTLTWGIGARYETAGMKFSGDARYAPSPVPDQLGRENYVDNDRLSLGAGFEAELNLWGMKLFGGFHIQGHLLVAREVKKDLNAVNPVVDEFPDNARDLFTGDPIPDAAGFQSNNPGFPGYSSSGVVFAAGFTLRTGI